MQPRNRRLKGRALGKQQRFYAHLACHVWLIMTVNSLAGLNSLSASIVNRYDLGMRKHQMPSKTLSILSAAARHEIEHIFNRSAAVIVWDSMAKLIAPKA